MSRGRLSIRDRQLGQHERSADAAAQQLQRLHQLFQQTGFDAEALPVVWQTLTVENDCHYCVPAHTAIAYGMKVDPVVINALRDRTELPTRKLQVLHLTTLSLVRNRGQLREQELADFFAAGYERRHLLEIILGISQKVISNYSNHQADTPVDKPFQKFEWSA